MRACAGPTRSISRLTAPGAYAIDRFVVGMPDWLSEEAIRRGETILRHMTTGRNRQSFPFIG
jgi:hypothetical protein